ncbi:hypothetical protein EB796_000744 [Bugula neritina]|uniref:Uncharacterized protein n=1 Tax=Bugula neritina TaxID=10212 RepID=A0A7J7KS35_BUGNE|nr:hypothetical protein EB796_000744 [Bugula neritina]
MTSSTQNRADVGLRKDHSSFKSAQSTSPTGARKSLLASLSSTTEHSEGLPPSPFLKFDIGDQCGSLHPSESVTKWNSSPVTQLLASAPSNTLPKVMTTPTKRSRSTELMTHSLDSLGSACLASGAVLESPTKRSKLFEKPHSIEFSADLSCTNVTACSKPEAASHAARSTDLKQEVAAFDLSINTDFADCLNILNTAEKAVQNRMADSEMVKPS